MKISGGDSELMSMPVDTLIPPWDTVDFNADVGHLFIEEDTKLLGDTDDENIDQKPSMDDLDLYLTATTTSSRQLNNTLAELKPLPPFTGYTGHLSINGISGHHYHTIATAPNSTRILIETNNNSVDTTNQNNVPYYSTDHVVSSSTMDNTIDSIKSESGILAEYVLPNVMEDDFVAMIGSAMADTTVPGNRGDEDNSRDSWLDLESWMSLQDCGTSSLPTSSKPNVGNSHSGSNNNNSSCNNNNNNNNSVSNNNNNNNNINNNNSNNNNNNNNSSSNNNNVLCPNSLPDFVTNSHFAVAPQPSQVIPFHPPMKQQPLQQSHHHNHQREINTTFSHMPILQDRLQDRSRNGPRKPPDSQEIAYNMSECMSPSSSTPYLAHSPPCHVVSTTDSIGFMPVHSSKRPSPELQVSFPHTTTPSKKSRSRTKSKIASSIVYSDGNLGKEKTVHRCNICNRGFLNKSNIKVHLRTHTGEKPFQCNICGKAFRQKAHLIKHAQIHKRVGRD